MRNLPSISNHGSQSVIPSSEAIDKAIALTFSKVTVIEEGIERQVNSDDFDTSPDAFIIIGPNFSKNVKEQLKSEVLRKGLNCHFIGDGKKTYRWKILSSIAKYSHWEMLKVSYFAMARWRKDSIL